MVDHLASNGLLQSLAVFLPESGLGTDANAPVAAAALSREDVLQALSLPADSALFRRVISRAEEGGDTGAADGAVVLTAAVAAGAGEGGGERGGAAEDVSQQQQQQHRRVCGLLEALVGEVAARSRSIAVDCNTQTEEVGRSHKENLGEGWEGKREEKDGGGAGGRAGSATNRV